MESGFENAERSTSSDHGRRLERPGREMGRIAGDEAIVARDLEGKFLDQMWQTAYIRFGM